MKIFLTLAVAFTLAILSFIPLHQASAQDDKSKDIKAEMMAKWQKNATPGDAHKVLNQFVGDWDYTVKWWNLPGGNPEISTSENEVKWIMGGRFLLMDVEGKSMGQEFQGLGILGYDNAKKEYTNVWIDSMSTGMMIATGSYDVEKKQLTETGSYTDTMTGQDKPYKGVTTFIDKDNYAYELFSVGPDGKELRMMVITYKRDSD